MASAKTPIRNLGFYKGKHEISKTDEHLSIVRDRISTLVKMFDEGKLKKDFATMKFSVDPAYCIPGIDTFLAGIKSLVETREEGFLDDVPLVSSKRDLKYSCERYEDPDSSRLFIYEIKISKS